MMKLEKYDVNIKFPEISINLSDTVDFFVDIKNRQTGIIKSKSGSINDLEIELNFEEGKLKYATNRLKKFDTSTQYFGYGLLERFEIINGSKTYTLKNGVSKASFQISDLTSKGEITEIESNYSKSHGYFRVALPVDEYTKVPNKYFWTNPFKIGTAQRVAGYLQIKIDQFNLGFFDYKIENEEFIFIECHDKIDNLEFEKLVETILYSFALISGCLINTTYNYLKFRNGDFSGLEGFRIKQNNESIITNYELFNPREFKTYFDLDSLFFFPKEIISNLSNTCYNSPRFLRALRILCNARHQPVEIEATSIFVVLETVKELIVINNSSKVSPFKEKEFADEIIKEFKQKINSIDDSHFNRKSSILNKLQDLNKPGNNESFKLAFELVGFDLTKKDKDCISMRNRFLHGNMPHDNEVNDIRTKELAKISLSAHFLTCCLILKYVGFEGYVKNFLKFIDLINQIDQVDEELFRKI